MRKQPLSSALMVLGGPRKQGWSWGWGQLDTGLLPANMATSCDTGRKPVLVSPEHRDPVSGSSKNLSPSRTESGTSGLDLSAIRAMSKAAWTVLPERRAM